MKAYLLAAGKGTRLAPYTDRHPKCLIPIHGTPLLAVWIELLDRHGVTEVLINTHHHADQVERFLDGARAGTSMTLRTVYEPQLLGSGGTIRQNRWFVEGDSDFVVAYADNLTNLNLAKMVDFHLRFRSMGGILTMGLIQAPDPKACGIVTLDEEDRIIRFVEKPQAPESDLANGGIYICGHEIFDVLEHPQEGVQEVLDLGHHVLPRLTGKMFGFPIAPYFLKDIGTPEAYRQALSHWPPEAQESAYPDQ
jgi:mannose-1-phosphate guanylyltransferase